MAVDEIAQLGVARDPRDAEGRGQVVGLEFALKATLELQQRTVLDVKQSDSAQVTIAQGVADFAQLAGVDDAGHVARDRVDEGAKTK